MFFVGIRTTFNYIDKPIDLILSQHRQPDGNQLNLGKPVAAPLTSVHCLHVVIINPLHLNFAVPHNFSLQLERQVTNPLRIYNDWPW